LGAEAKAGGYQFICSLMRAGESLRLHLHPFRAGMGVRQPFLLFRAG
jgi:hypothetical protein